MTVTVEFEIITPDLAKKIAAMAGIDSSTYTNRSGRQVKSYATDMATGRWLINGESIIFDTNGKLINGGKRILAAAQFGVSFPTFVVRGIDPDAADYIDQHNRRTSKDVAHVAGYDEAATLTATAATVVDIARTGLPSQQIVTHWNLLRVIQDHPGIADVRREVASSTLYDYYSPSDLAALVYLTREIDRAKSDDFFAQLAYALANPAEGEKNPIQLLAVSLQAINNDIAAGGHAGSSKTRYVRVTYTTKVWNAWSTGGKPRRLLYNKSETPARLVGLPADMFESYVTLNDPRLAGADQHIEYRARGEESLVRATVETITPEIAVEMLFNNGPLHDGLGRNRSPSKTTVVGYAREMLAGTWKMTGQAINISKTNRLLNGQHRLEACVRSGVPFTTVVMRNIDDDVFPTFDVGQQQTVSAILRSRGETYGTSIQGALRWIWVYREVGFVAFPVKPNLSELLDLFEEYPTLSHYALAARNPLYRAFKVPPSILLTLMQVFNEIDPVPTAEFFEKFASGANLDLGSPILKLRNKLLSLAAGRFDTSAINRLHLICLAWNAFRKGTRLSFPQNVNDLTAPPPFDKGAKPKASIFNKPLPASRRPASAPATLGAAVAATIEKRKGKPAAPKADKPAAAGDGWAKTPTR